jgi:hypothetical protein
MAIPVLASGQFLPSSAPVMCTSGAAPGSGGRGGMVLFGAISVMSTMVVRMIWGVMGWSSCRVYVKSGKNV